MNIDLKKIGIFVLFMCLVGLLVYYFWPEDNKKTEKLNLFDTTAINPPDSKPFFEKPKHQSYDQREIEIKKASMDYIKQFGGPFGEGETAYKPFKEKEKFQVELPEFKQTIKQGAIEEGPKFQLNIKSSKDYGFLPPPPTKSITSKAFSNYPSQKSAAGPFLYNVITSKTCSVEPQNHMIGMIVDTCDSLCSHDNQCMAYNYDFSNGDCKIYTSCDGLKDSAKLSKLFVKNMKIKM